MNMRKRISENSTVLQYISDYIDANGYPPTVREICTRFGYK
ncbi:MAG: repressor LexA, partial [Clostridia bacterium]|nr:repressor LexA [Clostridia bacterium]